MFGAGNTYFADSPVVIDVALTQWPNPNSPFKIVGLEVLYDGATVGTFKAESGGALTMSFDISSALRTIWFDYDFSDELLEANSALDHSLGYYSRNMREYSLRAYIEFIDSTDGEFTSIASEIEPGGQCLIGGFTEWERSLIDGDNNRSVAILEHTNPRNGDASTKPRTTPERVGKDSITSFVDFASTDSSESSDSSSSDGNEVVQTRSIFYPYNTDQAQDSYEPHAPIVLRDSQPYIDFLFVNRRGAVETCSAVMKEAMDIEISTQQYSRTERPTFQPTRSLMAIASGGRRSWGMSSGYQTREWAEWWTMEFLTARQWWMRHPKGDGTELFVPVTVAPAKKNNNIYDRTKQQLASVEFTVTLALEG